MTADAPRSADEPGEITANGMSGPPGPLLRLIRDHRVAFLVVGVANTVIGFAWFTFFLYTVGVFWGYMAALIFSHIAAVLCAFVLYRRFVFRVTGNVLRDLLRFETVYLAALGVNAILLPVLVELVGLDPLLSQALIVFVTTFISYFGHRYFSFMRRKGPTQ